MDQLDIKYKILDHKYFVAFFIVVIIGAIVFGAWHGNKKMNELSSQIETLSTNINQVEKDLASTTEEVKQIIVQTQKNLEGALFKEKATLEQKFSTVQSEVGNISGAVDTLEKLSKTDPELLQKYSKVFFLNEHYAPARLVEIPDEYEYFEEKNMQFYDKAWPYLGSMLSAAKARGIELYVYSAYRSFNTQEALKGQYSVTYGHGTANQFAADQGYSEHQLGTTVDLMTTGIDGNLYGFRGTSAHEWLLQNAYRFGFILSYPDGNDYYVPEPWHWRFVGVKLAMYLKNTNKNFYDLEQREIDEYLISIFD